jgi:hypothetical protein
MCEDNYFNGLACSEGKVLEGERPVLPECRFDPVCWQRHVHSLPRVFARFIVHHGKRIKSVVMAS